MVVYHYPKSNCIINVVEKYIFRIKKVTFIGAPMNMIS